MSMRFVSRPIVKLSCLCFIGLGLCLSAPVNAQTGNTETQTLMNRVNQLDNQIQTLSRYIYRQNPNFSGLESAAQEVRQEGDNRGFVNAFEDRISAMERQLQEITGQMEKLEFTMRQQKEMSQSQKQRLEALETMVQEIAVNDLSVPDPDLGPQALTPEISEAMGQDEAQADPSNEADNGADEAFDSLGDINLETTPGIEADDEAENPALRASLPEQGNPAQDYNLAFGLIKEQKFDAAERAFKAFLDEYPEHELSDNARYWLGETYYVRGAFEEAAVVFAEAFQQAPDGSKAADNLLKLGMSLSSVDQKGEACVTFNELLKRFPDASASLKQRARQQRTKLECE